MIQLQPIIDRINDLLEEDTDQSVTYAALEARLALEKVCYDPLRQRHDYISHADLKAWTPRHVVKRIMEEVDKDIGQTMTLSMSKTPYREDVKPEYEDYVEIGTEIGFKPQHISRMWQALSNLALHVRVPEHKNDQISAYGNKAIIRAKVFEVVEELERLAKGTMTFSGFGKEVSFVCTCSQKNRRRSDLLKPEQLVSCYNENCTLGYKVSIENDGSFIFELDSVEFPCAVCTELVRVPRNELFRMTYNDPKIIKCHKCEYDNQVQWILARANLPATSASATKLES